MPDIDSLFDELLEIQQNKKLPPVANWKPSDVGVIDIKIMRDGSWLHEKREIKRKEIVRLFSTILLKEQEDYYLITPAQKLKIVVEDAPFAAINMEVRGESPETDLLFETNVQDYVLIGKNNPIWMVKDRPYIHVRNGLNALLTRNVFYRLVDHTTEKDGQFWIRSCGESFSLGPC